MEFDYSKVDRLWIQERIQQLYSPLDEHVMLELLNEPGSGDEL